MAAFVKSVEYVEIALPSNTAVSVNLTKGQDPNNCVPFCTINLDSGTDDNVGNRYPDVYFEVGPKVTAIRDLATGSITIGVFVVEFDTTVVNVQSGTFSITGSSVTAAITDVSDVTKAFVVITYECTAGIDDFDNAQVRVGFNSTTELGFARAADGGQCNGHYFVVWTTGTDFLVEHVGIVPAATDETKTVVITSVTLSKTFVISHFEVSEPDDDVREAGWVVDISDSTHVRARRAFNSFGGSPGVATVAALLNAQIVSAGGSEFSVERNECDWGNATTKTVNITTIDQAKAIMVAGGDFGIMSVNENQGGDIEGCYATLKFNTDSQIIGTRGVNSTPDGTTMFEVVEFVLVADPTTKTVTASLEAAIQAQQTLSASLNAGVQKIFTRSASADAAVAVLETRTSSLEAAVHKLMTAQANLEAAVRDTVTRTAGLDAGVRDSLTRTAPLSAALAGTALLGAGLDANLDLPFAPAGTRTFGHGADRDQVVTAGGRTFVVPAGNRKH